MNLRNYYMLGSFTAVIAAGTLSLVPTQARSQEAVNGEDVQVLTRGPVHEAFAESVSLDPVEGMVVQAAPPELIEELPPKHELEGDNVTWISGYWAWDDERNDFIWVSGIWRNVPPDRQWVPGYWNDIGDGKYQWTSGYWADAEVEEVAYMPTAPPRSLEVGPNTAAPSTDHSWVPGNWVYADTSYNWRPGYWVAYRPNWTWVPSRYNWSPHGYVYVDGYWDYAVARRGVLFAPVYYNRHIYSEPHYSYTPAIVVALSVFADHLFIRPRSCHYYFGDYYAPRYRASGFYASHSWHTSRGGYDPIYAYQRWDHRRDSGWEDRRRSNYEYFRDHEDARPPRTWAAMRDYRDDRFDDRRNRRFAASYDSVVNKPMEGQRFRALDDKRRENYVSQAREIRKFSGERRNRETRSVATADRQQTDRAAVREKFTRSPIAGRKSERFAKDEAPPARPEASIPARGRDSADRRGDRRVDAEPQRKIEGDPKRRNEAESQRRTEGQPKGRNEAEPKRRAEGEPNRRTEAMPQRKTEAEPKRKSEAAPQRKAEAPQRREVAPQRKAEAPQRREAAPQRREVAPQRKAEAPQRREVAPQRKAEAPQRREVAPQRKAEAPQRREAAPQRREVAPQRKAEAPQRREVAPQRKAEAPQRREAAPQRREAAPQRRAEAAPKSRKSAEEEEKKNR